ncbi:tetratricopeptide repeat protein [Campylobacter sp. VTCC 70190]|uniref:tetratricopeptide repeat protein n=1 Tax=Campylobacter sp. VTCC 70190 TaxID=3392118 RepID=UPI00398E4BE3
MDFFFVEYRDPLVGLIILTILVFVVAVANYIWKIFANKDEEQKLEKFIKKFEMDSAHKELLRNSTLSFGNLSFLAEIFTKSGEFEKATQIYLIALEKCKDKQEREFIFISLAKVYFKAGFLERAKEVLLQALKLRPRNIQALKLLKIIYLKLRSYKENLELLECLFELNEEVQNEYDFIKALELCALNIDDEEKKQKLLELKIAGNAMLGRLIFEKYHLFLGQDFWDICDLLYKENEGFNLENQDFLEFFYALGRISKQKADFVFKNSHFKMLKILKDNSFNAGLEFSYRCCECKSVMPLFFYHCPVCYEFNTCKIIYEVKNNETH